MQVLVTGANGFIGRHVMDALGVDGHEGVPFDLPRHDVRDLNSVDDFHVEAVIHLAGRLGTAELFDRFDEAVDVNVKGTHRVLEYCRVRGARYVSITMPSVWANPYQATKACARILASGWHESFGVPVSHVRAFNAYGPGQACGPGHPQKIIPTFASLAYAGEPIPIWGDGEQTVDLVHAADVADVLVQALGFGDDETFDAGTGVEWTVNSVAGFVLNVTCSSSTVTHLPMRPGERPGTRLAAAGEGWEKLDRRPTLNLDRLAATIESYKP